jgi:hypothetical protein
VKNIFLLPTPANGYKTYAFAIFAVLSGVGMILSKNYDQRISESFQVLAVIFSGASVLGLRHAVAKLAPKSVVISTLDS